MNKKPGSSLHGLQKNTPLTNLLSLNRLERTTPWLSDAGGRRRMRRSVGRVERMGGQEEEAAVV